ncbi:MAG: Cell division integral membrane protein, YggT and half-length relatives, partial [uncultured Frankineae bacterium]
GSRRRRPLLRAARLPAVPDLPADHGVRVPAGAVLPPHRARGGRPRAGLLRHRSASQGPAPGHPAAAHRPGQPGPGFHHPVHRGAHPHERRRRPAL